MLPGWGSRDLAERLARALGGDIRGVYASMGLFRMARRCVHAIHEGMELEIYVAAPYTSVWVENFRVRSPSEIRFSFNEPDRISALLERVTDLTMRFFVMPGSDQSAVRAFAANPENERDLAALQLRRKERLFVTSEQMILHNRTRDSSLILDRIATLRRIFERYGGAADQRVLH